MFSQTSTRNDDALKACGAVAFVNLTHPDDIRRRTVQAGIRRHVMKDIGRARRKKRRAIVIPLECKSQPHQDMEETNHEAHGGKLDPASLPLLLDQSTHPSWSLNSRGILGVDLDRRHLEIVHFMRTESEYKYRAFRVIWFRMSFTDATAFYLSLATAIIFWDRRQGQLTSEFADNPESARYYAESLRQLHRRLNDPSECVSAGVVATVLGCLCHDTNVGNWERWAVHIDGLDHIRKLRGGFDGLENNIPLIAFWLDIVGRSVIDSFPRFPLPKELCPISSRRSDVPTALRGVLDELEDANDELLPISQALEGMHVIANTVDTNGHSPTFWQDEVGAIHLLGPLAHHLLSMPKLVQEPDETPAVLLVGELTRLACLILLSALKKGFSLNASDMAPLWAKFLALAGQVVHQPHLPLPDLTLWALITASILQHQEQMVLLVPYICTVMWSKQIADAHDAIRLAKDFIWIKVLDTQPCDLERDITEFSSLIDAHAG